MRGKRGKPRQLSGPELYLHDAPLETLARALALALARSPSPMPTLTLTLTRHDAPLERYITAPR